MEQPLNVDNLTKYYGHLLAVDSISFTLKPGEIVGLLGPNGAGKTTTLKTIVGLLRKDSGSISVMGFDHRSKEAKGNLAYISETPDIYDMLTVWEHVRFIAMAFGINGWEDRASELLKMFDLSDKKDELGANLSKGMRQKVMIICGLIHDPAVLLFDEPMIGLDPKAIRELKNMLFDSKRAGKSILISTHLLDTAEGMCDRVLVMKEGQLIASGTMDELKEQYHTGANSSLEDIFLEVTGNE